MKNFKLTHKPDSLKGIFNAIVNSSKFRYMVLLILTYLITITLTSCADDGVNPNLSSIDIADVEVSEDFNWSTSQHMLLKIQINPDYNESTSKYKGFPIDILSENDELIMRGALNENGFVRMDVLTPATLESIKIHSPITQDTRIIQNPYGSAVIGFNVKAIDQVVLKEINTDTDFDGVFDVYDAFPEDGNKAFQHRVPFKGFIHHVFEHNWPSVDDFDFNDFTAASSYIVTRNAKGKHIEADYNVAVFHDGAEHNYGFGLQVLQLGKLNHGELSDLSQIQEKIDVKNNQASAITVDPLAKGSVIVTNETTPLEYGVNNFTFTLNFSGLSTPIQNGIYNDFFLYKNNNRGVEIHTPQGRPTPAMTIELFGTMDDASDRHERNMFTTSNNLPWALEVWSMDENNDMLINPVEGNNLLDAAPAIKNWIESDGLNNKNWYESLIINTL